MAVIPHSQNNDSLKPNEVNGVVFDLLDWDSECDDTYYEIRPISDFNEYQKYLFNYDTNNNNFTITFYFDDDN